MDFGERGSGAELGGEKGGETVVGKYSMREESIFHNKKMKQTKSS